MKAIRNTILVALLFFIVYNFILYWTKPHVDKGQHQWQQNIMEAQEYVYGRVSPTVMVGSSLSARMGQDLLSDSVYNLSFSGGSIYTGLEIIEKVKQKPRRVLIESNIIDRPGDKAMTEQLFMPVIYQLRGFLPALREKYQPTNLMSAFLGKKSTKSNAASSPDPAIVEQLVQEHLKDYQKLPDQKLLQNNLNDLDDFVLKLTSEYHIEVRFYTMPVDCRLKDTPKYRYIQKVMHDKYPSHYWLPESDCSAYTYNDGEHLSAKGKFDFEDWFEKIVKE